MYQTIQGKTIDGEIKIRYQRTMIVENDQGRHLCWLVGEPGPKHTGINLPKPKPKKIPKPDLPKFPVRVMFPNGAMSDYPSINQARKDIGVSNSVAHRSYEHGVPVARGRAKGCRFVPIMED